MVKAGRQLTISAIENGTVIDHISSQATFKVLEILRLEGYDNVISVGVNLGSRKIGKKGLVKIAGRFLSQEEANKIALVSPEASLNIIRNYEVERKMRLAIPDSVEGIVKCVNPACITNLQRAKTRFMIISKEPLRLRCVYCERAIGKGDIELI